MPTDRIINPTLAENIPLVIALAQSKYGNNPGILEAYTTYSLGEEETFALTLPVLQLVAAPNNNLNPPPIRLDVFEPSSENNGSFGRIYPVIKSIIPQPLLQQAVSNEMEENAQKSPEGASSRTTKPFIDTVEFHQQYNGVFDDSASYIIKEMVAKQNTLSDKPNKPHWLVRVANREQYLGGQHPTLGIHYTLVKREDTSLLHMNRAPGLSLEHYRKKLSGEQFLSLVCTLIEQVPQQIHRIVNTGKHQGRLMIHCDLKSENIMAGYINGQWIVTVIDMGLVKTIENNGHYSTLKPYGNKLAWDGEMLRADINHQPKIYDPQSDVYALFVCILELAGAPMRDGLTDEEALKDIENPNFTGIFKRMNFDLSMENRLAKALRGALSANKIARTPHSEVLIVFQDALAEVRKNQLQPQPQPQPQVIRQNNNTAPFIAEHLKQWAEHPLDNILQLKSWIETFRRLRNLANSEENERFNRWFATKTNLQIRSPLIFNLLRFKLLDEYNDNTCVRLMHRNEQLLAPILLAQNLTPVWQRRFQALPLYLPLQLTSTQAEYYVDIGMLKQSISYILRQNLTERAHKILHLMRAQLDEQLKLDFALWLKQLAPFAKLFNKEFQCVISIEKLHHDITPYLLKDDLRQQFAPWATEILNNAVKGTFPENQEAYFKHYDFLIKLLTIVNIKRQELAHLFHRYPELNQSSLSWKLIEESTKQLQLSDLPAVISLSRKIELLILMNDIFACLQDQGNQEYKTLIQANQTKFMILINQLVQQTLSEPEVKIQLDKMLSYFESLDRLIDFMEDYTDYPYVRQAIDKLCDQNYKIVALADATNIHEKGQKELLRNLNQGLHVILSDGHNLSSPLERIFTEMTRYFACPRRYLPPTPTAQVISKVYSQGNLNPMFLAPPKAQQDEIVTSFSYRL